MNFRNLSIAIIFVYSILFLILPKTEYQPADPGLKILQIKDFIKSNYSDFSAYYPAKDFDREVLFFPVRPPFAYRIADKAYYVFPFHATLLFFPFYKLGGVFLLNLFCVILGLLLIFFVNKIAVLVKITDNLRKYLVLFTAFGSGTAVYTFTFGEGIFATLLVTISIFLIFNSKNSKYPQFLFFLSGLLAGFAVFFRIELVLFCFLFLFGILLYRLYFSWKDLIYISAGLFICAIILISTNYKITENIFGLRGIEFIQYSGKEFPIEKRIVNVFSALFVSNKGLGLFSAWPIFSFLFPLIFLKNLNLPKELKFLIFVTLPFTILIPLLVKNDDGSILGPRFTLTLQPLLIISTFYAIQIFKTKGLLQKWISKIKYIVYYSIFISILAFAVLFLFLKSSHEINQELDQKISGDFIILRNEEFYNFLYPALRNRKVITIEKKDSMQKFIQDNFERLPEKISILTFSPNGNLGSLLFSFDKLKITDLSNKNGIFIYNIRLTHTQ